MSMQRQLILAYTFEVTFYLHAIRNDVSGKNAGNQTMVTEYCTFYSLLPKLHGKQH